MSGAQRRADPAPKSNVVHLFGGAHALTGARMKEIAAQSGDALFLADGPVNPDWRLLDLCGDALHFAKLAEHAYATRPGTPRNASTQELENYRRADQAKMAAYYDNTREVTNRLRTAKRMKATTPAGIYAKALLVKCSRTGATELAMSLATDLVDCEALRATLWPAGN